ncbi:MAG: type II secretion system F family protein [Gammaproteobacteria bacterium]|nr:type II secretion system F family protein [Gammaproteobacteria bacterium]
MLVRLMKLNKVPSEDVSRFLELFEELLSAHYSVADALEYLERFPVSHSIKPITTNIRSQLNQGRSLANVLAVHEDVFGGLAVALVRQAEHTGNLVQAIREINQYRDWLFTLKKSLISSLWYPLISSSVLFAAALFQILYLVPKATDFMDKGDVSHSFFSLNLIRLHEVIDSGLLPGVFVAAVLLLLFFVRRRLPTDSVYIFSRFHLVRYYRTIAVLLRHRLPLVRAMQVGENLCADKKLCNRLKRVREAVSGGQAFSQSVQTEHLIPQGLISMLTLSEKSGEFIQRIETIGHLLLTQEKNRIESFFKKLVPLSYLFAGGILLWIVLGVFLPIYQRLIEVGGLL